MDNVNNINNINQALSRQKKMINSFNYFKKFKSMNNSNSNAFESFDNKNEKSINNNNNSLTGDKEKLKELEAVKFNFRKKILLKGLQIKGFIDNKKNNKLNFNNNDINKSNIIQPKKNVSLLQLSADFRENNNCLLSPQYRIPKKLQFRNYFFKVTNEMPNLKRFKRQKSGLLIFHDLGKNLLEKNKYIIDLMNNKGNENNELLDDKGMKYIEKNEMEKKEIKIEKLAKDLFLFQNEKHFKNINLKKNNSFSNLLNISEESNNLSNAINKINNLNRKVSPMSRISTRTPSSRIYSGKIINNFKSANINKFSFNKNKIHDMLSNRELSLKPEKEKEKGNEYYIERTNKLPPFSDKSKNSFLSRKIFSYFSQKRSPKVMSKFLNNKLNLVYSEDEKEFESMIVRENLIKKEKGKGKILRVGKADTEKRSESMKHQIEFIKKVFDYAYPEILIYKIRQKFKMDQNEIRKRIEKKEIKEKMKIHKIFLKKKAFLNSIKIEKI